MRPAGADGTPAVVRRAGVTEPNAAEVGVTLSNEKARELRHTICNLAQLVESLVRLVGAEAPPELVELHAILADARTRGVALRQTCESILQGE